MEKNFYTASLMGGLGNQMFQIAHAICQGWKHNVEVCFSPTSFTPNQGNPPTNYLNNIFKKINFSGKRGETIICGEKSWNKPDLDFDPKKSIEFYGYFQGSHNFLDFSDKIVDLFSPEEDFLEKFQKLYPDFDSKNSISVHIRRGDYQRFSDVHGIIDISYIEHCLSKCNPNKQIFIFTDDKLWAKNTFQTQKYTVVENLQDYEEIWAISLCSTNIMSCSSFSWWGSFLNKNEKKKVFVPNKWFGPSGPHPYENIYEKNWEQINVNLINGFLYLDLT